MPAVGEKFLELRQPIRNAAAEHSRGFAPEIFDRAFHGLSPQLDADPARSPLSPTQDGRSSPAIEIEHSIDGPRIEK